MGAGQNQAFFKLSYGKGAQILQGKFQGRQMQSAPSAVVPGEVPAALYDVPLLRDTYGQRGW